MVLQKIAESGLRVGVDEGERGGEVVDQAGTQPHGLTGGQQLTHGFLLLEGPPMFSARNHPREESMGECGRLERVESVAIRAADVGAA